MCGGYTGEHDELKISDRQERVEKRIKSGTDLIGRTHWDQEYAYYEYYDNKEGEEE